MSLSYILAGMALILLKIGRYVLNKEAAGIKKCNPADVSFSNSSWVAVGAIIITASFWNTEFIPFFTKGTLIIFPLFMSIVKGFALYILVKNFAQVSGKSLSSGIFTSHANFLVGSLLIMAMFKDHLNLIDVLSVVAIGLVGIVFFIKGHAKTLNRSDKKAYFIIIACTTVCMISDRITVVPHSWAVHLAVSSLVWFTIGIVSRLIGKRKKQTDRFTILKHKTLLLLGAVYLMGEIFLMYCMQNVFYSVITPAILMLTATPITMLISALKYTEAKWQEQMIFSLLMIAPVITFILF